MPKLELLFINQKQSSSHGCCLELSSTKTLLLQSKDEDALLPRCITAYTAHVVMQVVSVVTEVMVHQTRNGRCPHWSTYRP